MPRSDTAAVSSVPASLVVFGAPPSPATATVIEQGPGRRAARALAGLGLFWAIAAACVFIPVAHFLLVPTFLLCGIVVAALRLREGRRLVALRGACPRCSVEQDFGTTGRFDQEREVVCPKCHARLRLVAA